ncbi:MAG: VTT domain-containing protein [Kofleriaceae bacterium]
MSAAPSSARTWRVLVGAAALLGAALLLSRLPVQPVLTSLVERVRGAGAMGGVAFAGAYVVTAVLMLPGSALTLGAGFVYGPAVGALLVIPASVLAAVLAFALARGALRARVSRWAARDRRARALDRAVGRAGFRIVLLLRLSPVIPYSLLNYALGITDVRLRDYALASAIGMLPGTLLYVSAGAALTELSQLGAGRVPSWALWGGLVASALALFAVARIARRALVSALDEPEVG